MNKIRVVEIGGTHIRRGDITNVDISNITRERTAEVLIGDVLASLDRFIRTDWSSDIQKLAILVAGPVRDNIIERMPNFPAFPKNIDLTKELKIDVPIFIFNDMTAAVTGMAELLKKQGLDTPFWGLTWSTGLGGKFCDGEKISIDTEIGHEIMIDGVEAEKLLGGGRLAEETGLSPEQISHDFYLKKAQVLGQFLVELDKIAPSSLYVFKGAIAEHLLVDEKIQSAIKSQFKKEIKIILSPEPQKDSFLGAWELAKKAL